MHSPVHSPQSMFTPSLQDVVILLYYYIWLHTVCVVTKQCDHCKDVIHPHVNKVSIKWMSVQNIAECIVQLGSLLTLLNNFDFYF